MNFASFFMGGEKGSTLPPATTPEDFAAREKIINALCSKRKSLEWNLSNREPSTRDTYLKELEEHVEKMTIFGVSESDYAVWLTKDEKSRDETVH